MMMDNQIPQTLLPIENDTSWILNKIQALRLKKTIQYTKQKNKSMNNVPHQLTLPPITQINLILQQEFNRRARSEKILIISFLEHLKNFLHVLIKQTLPSFQYNHDTNNQIICVISSTLIHLVILSSKINHIAAKVYLQQWKYWIQIFIANNMGKQKMGYKFPIIQHFIGNFQLMIHFIKASLEMFDIYYTNFLKLAIFYYQQGVIEENKLQQIQQNIQQNYKVHFPRSNYNILSIKRQINTKLAQKKNEQPAISVKGNKQQYNQSQNAHFYSQLYKSLFLLVKSRPYLAYMFKTQLIQLFLIYNNFNSQVQTNKTTKILQNFNKIFEYKSNYSYQVQYSINKEIKNIQNKIQKYIFNVRMPENYQATPIQNQNIEIQSKEMNEQQILSNFSYSQLELSEKTEHTPQLIHEVFIMTEKLSKVCGKLEQKYFILAKFMKDNQEGQKNKVEKSKFEEEIDRIKKTDLVYLQQVTNINALKSMIEEKIKKTQFADIFIIDVQQSLSTNEIYELISLDNVQKILIASPIHHHQQSDSFDNQSKIIQIKSKKQLYEKIQKIRSTMLKIDINQKYVQAFTIITGKQKGKINKFRLNFDYYIKNFTKLQSQLKDAFLRFIKTWLEWQTSIFKTLGYKKIQQIIQSIFTKRSKDGENLIKFYTQDNPFHVIFNRSLRVLDETSQFYYIAYPFFLVYDYIYKKYVHEVKKNRELISNEIKVRNTYVYRSCFLIETAISVLQSNIGHFMEIQGYISTSTSQNVAINFKQGSVCPKNYYIFQIEILAEIHQSLKISGFYDISGISCNSQEKEILFNPKNMFKVIEVNKTTERVKLQYIDIDFLKNTKDISQQPKLKQLFTYHQWVSSIKIENQGDILKEEGNRIEAKKYYEKNMLWVFQKLEIPYNFNQLQQRYGGDKQIMENVLNISKYILQNYSNFINQQLKTQEQQDLPNEKYVVYLFLKFVHIKLSYNQTKQTLILTNLCYKLLTSNRTTEIEIYYFLQFNMILIQKKLLSSQQNQGLKEKLEKEKIKNLIDLSRMSFYQNKTQNAKMYVEEIQNIGVFANPIHRETQLYADYLNNKNIIMTYEAHKVKTLEQRQQAIKTAVSLIQIFSKYKNGSDNKILRMKYNLMDIYNNMRRYTQALQLGQRSWEECKNSFGADHDLFIIFRDMIGHISFTMANSQRCQEIYQEVLEKQRQLLVHSQERNGQITEVESLVFYCRAKKSYQLGQSKENYSKLKRILHQMKKSKIQKWLLYRMYEAFLLYSYKNLFFSCIMPNQQKIPQYSEYLLLKNKIIDQVQSNIFKQCFLATQQLLVLIKIAYNQKDYEEMYIRARQLEDLRNSEKLQFDILFFVAMAYLSVAEIEVILEKEQEIAERNKIKYYEKQIEKLLFSNLSKNQNKQQKEPQNQSKPKQKDPSLQKYKDQIDEKRGKQQIESIIKSLERIMKSVQYFSKSLQVKYSIFHARTQVLFCQLIAKLKGNHSTSEYLNQKNIQISTQLSTAEHIIKQKSYTQTQQYASLCHLQAKYHLQQCQISQAQLKINECLEIRRIIHDYNQLHQKYKPIPIIEIQKLQSQINQISTLQK